MWIKLHRIYYSDFPTLEDTLKMSPREQDNYLMLLERFFGEDRRPMAFVMETPPEKFDDFYASLRGDPTNDADESREEYYARVWKERDEVKGSIRSQEEEWLEGYYADIGIVVSVKIAIYATSNGDPYESLKRQVQNKVHGYNKLFGNPEAYQKKQKEVQQRLTPSDDISGVPNHTFNFEFEGFRTQDAAKYVQTAKDYIRWMEDYSQIPTDFNFMSIKHVEAMPKKYRRFYFELLTKELCLGKAEIAAYSKTGVGRINDLMKEAGFKLEEHLPDPAAEPLARLSAEGRREVFEWAKKYPSAAHVDLDKFWERMAEKGFPTKANPKEEFDAFFYEQYEISCRYAIDARLKGREDEDRGGRPKIQKIAEAEWQTETETNESEKKPAPEAYRPYTEEEMAELEPYEDAELPFPVDEPEIPSAEEEKQMEKMEKTEQMERSVAKPRARLTLIVEGSAMDVFETQSEIARALAMACALCDGLEVTSDIATIS